MKSQLLFTTLFGAAYFLFFIFSEDFSFLWISPFLVLLFLFMLWSWKKTTTISRSAFWIACAISGILALLLCLTPFSVKVSHSVLRWSSLATAATAMIFFLAAPISPLLENGRLRRLMILNHSIILILQLIILSSSYLQSIAPVMSVLHFSGGQNHAYILYLIALPLCVLELDQKNKKQWLMLMIAFAVGVLVSFSRVGILLLGIELFGFVALFTPLISRLTRRLLVGIGALVALVLFSFIFFTLQPRISTGTDCIVPIFHQQLCKSFSADRRLTYIFEAIQGVKEKPMFGYGGGTFDVISFRFRPVVQAYSLYVHNEYLQLIVEFGILGVLICIGYLAGVAFGCAHWSKLTIQTKMLVFTSVLLAIDAFFNFNWEFTGVLLVEMLIWAWCVRAVLAEVHVKTPQVPVRTLLVPELMIGLPLLYVSLLFIVSETFLSQARAAAFTLFPYDQQRAQRIIFDTAAPKEVKDRVFKLYANDITIAKFGADFEVDLPKKYASYQFLEELDPLNIDTRVRMLGLATQVDDPETVRRELRWIIAYYGPFDQYKIREADPTYLERLIRYANQHAESDPEMASQITSLAYRFEPWRVNEVKTFFLMNPQRYPTESVLNVLNNQAPHSLWSYLEPLNSWTWEKMRVAAESDNWDDLHVYTRVLLLHSDWDPHVLWKYLSDLLRIKINHLPHQADDTQRQQLIRAWRDSLETIQKFGKVGDTPVDTQGWEQQINAAAQ